MAEAKLFTVGGSQAVRLPKEFRMLGDRVRIRKDGESIILDPIHSGPGRTIEEVSAWLKEIQALAGPDGFERPEQPPIQERDWSKFD
jgi:antitoxin VapB